MWPCGSKTTSRDSWRCCGRMPGSLCRRSLSGWRRRAAIASLFQTPPFTAAPSRRLRPLRANGSPACGLYKWDAETGVYQLFGLAVLEVVDDQIAYLVAFLERESFSFFALPPTLPRLVEEG